MARRPRSQIAGGVYHVYARGNDRLAIFRDDVDRQRYMRLLRGAIRRTEWRVLSYCLMANHVHLLLETPVANLSRGMQWFHGHYGRYFNDRHGRVGHLFQGRYGAVLQASDEQLRQAFRYIALNPVTAGLTPDARDFGWSAHRALLGLAPEGVVDRGRAAWYLGAGDLMAGARRYAALTQT